MHVVFANITSRPPGGTHGGGPFDRLTPATENVVVKAGTTLTISGTRRFKSSDKVGKWEVYATYEDENGNWHDGPSVYVNVK